MRGNALTAVLLVLTATLAATGAAAAPGTTDAPTVPGNGSTTTASGTVGGNTDAGDDEPTDVVAQVDTNLQVLDYYMEDGEMVVTLRNTAHIDKFVTVSEVTSGTGKFAIRRYKIGKKSTTTIRLTMRRPSSTGVTLVTEASMAAGQGLKLDTSSGGGVKPPYRSDLMGLGGGISMSLAGVVFAIKWWTWRRDEEVTQRG